MSKGAEGVPINVKERGRVGIDGQGIPLSDEVYHRQLLIGLIATWNKYLEDKKAQEELRGEQTEKNETQRKSAF